jgi:hypothetical protein
VNVGVIAEGIRDEPIFQELIPKILPSVSAVVVRPTRGKSKFISLFPNLLWTLYVKPVGLVDKALVIRDANGDDPDAVENAMRLALNGRNTPAFRKDIALHVTRKESETWLLADVAAINRVAARHATGAMAVAVPGPLENIVDAKERFVRLLTQAGLLNVDAIVREVVREIDLAVVRQHCPGFGVFEQKVVR